MTTTKGESTMSSTKELREASKTTVMAAIAAALSNAGEDVGQCASNEINMPVVLADGTEEWIVVKVSIPTGTRDGDPYDGYGEREDYQIKCATKAAKAKEQAEKKAKKIAADQAKRDARAAAKTQKNNI